MNKDRIDRLRGYARKNGTVFDSPYPRFDGIPICEQIVVGYIVKSLPFLSGSTMPLFPSATLPGTISLKELLKDLNSLELSPTNKILQLVVLSSMLICSGFGQQARRLLRKCEEALHLYEFPYEDYYHSRLGNLDNERLGQSSQSCGKLWSSQHKHTSTFMEQTKLLEVVRAYPEDIRYFQLHFNGMDLQLRVIPDDASTEWCDCWCHGYPEEAFSDALRLAIALTCEFATRHVSPSTVTPITIQTATPRCYLTQISPGSRR